MVAAQAPVGGMQHHAGGAASAAGGPAASLAGQHRRISTAIDEEQALLAFLQPRRDRRKRSGAQALLGRVLAHVDGAHHRELGAWRGALGKIELLVAPEHPVVPGLERWRSGAKDHRAPGKLRAVNRRVAR
jgi:hypothetical protein